MEMINDNHRKKLGIYVHIPFCARKCLYCDFLSAKADPEEQREYIDALIKEIEYYALDDADFSGQYETATIFFGGGTPSIVKPEYIERIIEAVKDRFLMAENPEITIECNPGTANREKLQAYRKMGINRISFGLQSANDEELKKLGRIHDYAAFLETIQMAREEGFNNINVDLMSAIPGQTLESYKDTLEKVIALKPEHISSYSLIIEEETPFYDIYGEDNKQAMAGVNLKGEVVNDGSVELWPDLPDEDTERAMYYLTDEVLSKAGYHRYEISNYSLDGYECSHNKSYWNGTDYIGFGLGASSYVKGIRYSNTEDWYKYLDACKIKGNAQNQPYYVGAGDYLGEDEEYEVEVESAKNLSSEEFGALLLAEKYHEAVQLVSKNEQMEEFMYLGLRMMKGISKSRFKELFHIDIEDVYGNAINKLVDEKLLLVEGDCVKLTSLGIDVSNRVLANFLL